MGWSPGGFRETVVWHVVGLEASLIACQSVLLDLMISIWGCGYDGWGGGGGICYRARV